MPKGSIPRIGTEQGLGGPPVQTVLQQVTPPVPQGFVNPGVLGLAAGPLGLRRTKADVAAQIQRLVREMGESQAVDQPIPVIDPGQTPPVRVPPELPRQPPPLAMVGPPPVVSPEPELPAMEAKPEPMDPGKIVPTPMQHMAESGAEARVYRGLQYDAEFLESLFWRASPERRKIIEETRCGKMNWDSLLINYEVTQEVMVWKRPKEVRVDFRSMTTDDEYLVRRILFEKYLKTQPEYEVGSIVSTCAAGTISIGDMVLPAIPPVHLSESEKRKEVLEQRLKMVLRLPYILSMDIAINYAWFVMRMNKELRAGDVGNG